jgi:hypothetical protein
MRKNGGPEFECLWNEGVDDFYLTLQSLNKTSKYTLTHFYKL